MVVEKNNKVEEYKFKKGNLNFAVVGHVAVSYTHLTLPTKRIV